MSFIKIAHRGAPKIAPENTIASFRKALEFDIDCIELDVHITKDNEIVVMHDSTLNRTTDMKGELAGKTLSEIKQADAGSWYNPKFKGERIPTLRETLEFINKRVITVIEIKDDWIGPQVVNLIEEMKLEDYVIIISFHSKVISDIREEGSTVQTGLLISEADGDDDILKALDLVHRVARIGANHLTVNYNMITPMFAYQIRKRGLSLWAWTVDDADIMASLSNMRISGITSNYPDLFKVVDRKSCGC